MVCFDDLWLVFFFKQKTAYEMRIRLEFRRVLFRSGGGQHLGEAHHAEVLERAVDDDGLPRVGVGQRARDAEVRGEAVADRAVAVADDAIAPEMRLARSDAGR